MKLFRVWKACGAVVIASLAFCATAYINDAVAVIGEGDDSGGVTTNCGFLNAYQGLCNDNEDGSVKNGGASWHIYSTSDYSGPVYDEVNGILSGGVTVDKIKQDCPASKYGWYLAYGWDGRNDGSGYRHLGPAKHGDGIISNALYNSYRGALSFEQTKLWIQGTLGGIPVNGTVGYGRQLNEGVAEKLYELERNTNVIPDGVGYFCFSGAAFQEFEGRTRAFEGSNQWADTADDRKVATKWINKGKDAVSLTIIGCDSANGCNIRFRHDLKRKYGEDATKYKIKRTSNSSAISSGWIVSETSEKFENVSNGTMKIVKENRVNMRPGQIVCETMEFLVEGKSKWASTTACVKVVGDAQPDGASTLLDMKVKNNMVSKYDKYDNMVYAKPGDELEYMATYNPTLQYTINIKPGSIKINNGGKIANGGGLTLRQLFDNKNGSMPDWKNAFSVVSDGFTFSEDYIYEIGITDKQKEPNKYKVSKNDVGMILKEIAKTNAGTETSTTPSQVSFALDGKDVIGKVITDSLSDEASAIIPYNFNNKTKINDINGILYAGEKVNISYTIFTEPKENSVLGGEPYATLVKNPKWKVEICYGDRYENCYESEEKNGQYLHQNEDIDETATKSDNSTRVSINVPDVPAGTKVRVRSAVYPATSGASDNWQDAEGDHKWAYSESTELVVAKKPSFQVWGGSVYSAKDIQVLVAEKQHVMGLNNFNDVANGENNMNYVFGSWTELGLMANGVISGLASGAGTGYKSSKDALLAKSDIGVNEFGGSEERSLNYCLRSTLSFANDKCRSDVVGGLNGVVQNTDSEALIARFIDGGENVTNIELNGGENLGSIEIESGTTLYRKNGDLYIGDNVKYKTNTSYDSLANVPKIIIYASGDIRIDCKAKEIDAVLISKGNINTCADIEGGVPEVNSVMRSNELIINGAIIAETLTLGRTYGAATGVNSIVPAEIINYDSSLYLWANQKSDVTKTGKIVTTYQKELSPRY